MTLPFVLAAAIRRLDGLRRARQAELRAAVELKVPVHRCQHVPGVVAHVRPPVQGGRPPAHFAAEPVAEAVQHHEAVAPAARQVHGLQHDVVPPGLVVARGALGHDLAGAVRRLHDEAGLHGHHVELELEGDGLLGGGAQLHHAAVGGAGGAPVLVGRVRAEGADLAAEPVVVPGHGGHDRRVPRVDAPVPPADDAEHRVCVALVPPGDVAVADAPLPPPPRTRRTPCRRRRGPAGTRWTPRRWRGRSPPPRGTGTAPWSGGPWTRT